VRTSRLASRILGSTRVRAVWSRLRAAPALGPVLHGIAQRVLPPGPVWVVVQGGPLRVRQFLCDPRFHMGYIRGDHEPWVVEWLSQRLQRGGTFVDVGAHLGYFTLIAADIVGPKGRVIAFEPDPRNAAILEANVTAAGQGDRVEIVRAAVGAEDGVTPFLMDRDYSSRVPAEGEAPRAAAVMQRALDGLDLDPGTVIKVDAEGAELHVLLGARRHLGEKRGTWIIEVHEPALEEAVLATLRQCGYAPEAYAPAHPVYADYRRRYVLARSVPPFPQQRHAATPRVRS